MNLIQFTKRGWRWFWSRVYRCQFKNIHKTSLVNYTTWVGNPDNLFMEEHTNINGDACIMNDRAKFIMKKWSGAAVGLIVATGNHMSIVGKPRTDVTNKVKDLLDTNNEMDKDVIVQEEVWIGSNVTLLAGVIVGRGSEIGSGCVLRSSNPPYSVVVGNPGKVVGFRFTPEEILEHEKKLYSESERLPIELLEKNYKKYFLDRIKDIKQITKL